MGSMKRKFEELMSVNTMAPSYRRGRPPLAFYDSELPGGASNSAIPLLVRASMANADVRRVLIDTGASCNIMYTSLFKTLQLTEKKGPILGDRLPVSLQLHYRENRACLARGCMFNRSPEVEVPCKGGHHRLS
jgi:hypothetical protein